VADRLLADLLLDLGAELDRQGVALVDVRTLIRPATSPGPWRICVTLAALRRLEADGGPPAERRMLDALTVEWRLVRNGLVFLALGAA